MDLKKFEITFTFYSLGQLRDIDNFDMFDPSNFHSITISYYKITMIPADLD